MRCSWTIIFLLGCCAAFLYPVDARAQRGGFVGCEEILQIPRDECEALERFYASTHGDEWYYNTGWLRSNQPCGWFGIQCNTKEWPRNITRIEMFDNNVGGNIPGDLSRLPELTHLVIENTLMSGVFTFLEGTLPVDLSKLPHLEVIRLSRQKIAGELPDAFGQLSNLKELVLAENLLDDFVPTSYGNLSELESLDLSGNLIRGNIPVALGRLSNLQHLNLSHNRLSGAIPDSLGNLTRLRSLVLDSNNLTGRIPHSIGRLDSLFYLSLRDNKLSGPLSPVVARQIPGYSTCRLENNGPDFCIPDREVYRDISSSETMCGISLDASCSFCATSSALPDAACQSLEYLFYGTDGHAWFDNSNWLVTDSPCEWNGIGCEADQVTSLTLPDNNLAGTLPKEFGGLATLKAFDLSGNHLRGAIPFSVAAMGAAANSCRLDFNDGSLCIPAEGEYAALGLDSICQLPLANTCSAAITTRITSFAARVEASAVVLFWTTDLPSSFVSFDIEKKTGARFVFLQSVDGTLNQGVNPSYEVRIPELEEGLHVFRIRQRNDDTSFLLSEELEVLLGLEAGFVIDGLFPNPFSTTATLRLAVAESQQASITLYNALGQRVRELYQGVLPASRPQLIAIDGSFLPAGLYFVQIEGEMISTTVPAILKR